MKTFIIATLAMAFLAMPAITKPASALTIFGLEIKAPVEKKRCHNIDGNYFNVAEQACSDNGSGGVGFDLRSGHDKCPYETK